MVTFKAILQQMIGIKGRRLTCSTPTARTEPSAPSLVSALPRFLAPSASLPQDLAKRTPDAPLPAARKKSVSKLLNVLTIAEGLWQIVQDGSLVLWLPDSSEPQVSLSPDAGCGSNVTPSQDRLSDLSKPTGKQLRQLPVTFETMSSVDFSQTFVFDTCNTNDHKEGHIPSREDGDTNDTSSGKYVNLEVLHEKEMVASSRNQDPHLDRDVPLSSIGKENLLCPSKAPVVQLRRVPLWLNRFLDEELKVGDAGVEEESRESRQSAKASGKPVVAAIYEQGRPKRAAKNRPDAIVNNPNNTKIAHLLSTPSDQRSHNFLPPAIMADLAEPVNKMSKDEILAKVLDIFQEEFAEHRILELKNFVIPPSIRATLGVIWDLSQHEKAGHDISVFKMSLLKFGLELFQMNRNFPSPFHYGTSC